MRAMLGVDGNPTLLVELHGTERIKSVFDFTVLNGGWAGTFDHGNVTVHGERGHLVENVDVISIDPVRLGSGESWFDDWKEVFENWENLEYVHPVPNDSLDEEVWDDDIPF